MNSKLKDLFLNSKNFSFKWEKYFDVYEEYFSKFKDKNITFVEIGVYNGGSLKIWKNYFGPKSRIIGIDINPDCKKFEDDRIYIHHEDATDDFVKLEDFLKQYIINTNEILQIVSTIKKMYFKEQMKNITLW